jgi:hypothetical protein
MGEWQQPSQPQVPQAYPGYGQQQYVQHVVQDNQLALFSLIAGICSWVFLPFIAAVAAVVMGHMARKQIAESNGTQGGDGMAVAGLILGYSHLVLSCLAGAFVLLMVFGMFAAVGVGAAAQ